MTTCIVGQHLGLEIGVESQVLKSEEIKFRTFGLLEN